MFFEKAVLKILGKFLENHFQQGTYRKLLTEHELSCWCFSRNFPKIFRGAISKENLRWFHFSLSSLADVFPGISQKDSERLFQKKTFQWFHISLKNTSRWVLLMRQHSLMDVNSLQSWPWNQNGIYHRCGCCNDSQSCE